MQSARNPTLKRRRPAVDHIRIAPQDGGSPKDSPRAHVVRGLLRAADEYGSYRRLPLRTTPACTIACLRSRVRPLHYPLLHNIPKQPYPSIHHHFFLYVFIYYHFY